MSATAGGNLGGSPVIFKKTAFYRNEPYYCCKVLCQGESVPRSEERILDQAKGPAAEEKESFNDEPPNEMKKRPVGPGALTFTDEEAERFKLSLSRVAFQPGLLPIVHCQPAQAGGQGTQLGAAFVPARLFAENPCLYDVLHQLNRSFVLHDNNGTIIEACNAFSAFLLGAYSKWAFCIRKERGFKAPNVAVTFEIRGIFGRVPQQYLQNPAQGQSFSDYLDGLVQLQDPRSFPRAPAFLRQERASGGYHANKLLAPVEARFGGVQVTFNGSPDSLNFRIHQDVSSITATPTSRINTTTTTTTTTGGGNVVGDAHHADDDGFHLYPRFFVNSVLGPEDHPGEDFVEIRIGQMDVSMFPFTVALLNKVLYEALYGPVPSL